MLRDIDNRLAEDPGHRRTKARPWLPRAVVGVLAMAACAALLLPRGVPVAAANWGPAGYGSPIGAHAAVTLARQGDGAVPADPPAQGTGSDGQEGSETDSKATPPPSTPEDLEPFTPSETIEAGQGVDFPYDI